MGTSPMGTVRVTEQGLYYRFSCRCKIHTNMLCRLKMRVCQQEWDLGVLVPTNGDFGVDTNQPIKRFPEGEMTFFLRPAHQPAAGRFVPIRPEEPFDYLSRLFEAKLAFDRGQAGIWLTDPDTVQPDSDPIP